MHAHQSLQEKRARMSVSSKWIQKQSVFRHLYYKLKKNIIKFEIAKDISMSCDIFQSRTADRNSRNVTLYLTTVV